MRQPVPTHGIGFVAKEIGFARAAIKLCPMPYELNPFGVGWLKLAHSRDDGGTTYEGQAFDLLVEAYQEATERSLHGAEQVTLACSIAALDVTTNTRSKPTLIRERSR